MEHQYRTGKVGKEKKGAHPGIRPARPLLIVLEGIDLAGRTTQVHLLHDWLLAQNYPVTVTALRTSPLISHVLSRARKEPQLRPLTYSLLFAADHIDRTQQVIKPALARGEIVLADRYTYTAFARDAARGLDNAWVQNLYRHTIQPDAVFYLHISPEEAVQRRLALQQRLATEDARATHGKVGKHRKTSPVHVLHPQLLTRETLESFRNFEMKMYSAYQDMQKTFGFTVIEGDQSIDFVQSTLRRSILRLLLEV